MKTRSIVILIISILLVGVLGLCGLTAWGSYRAYQSSGVKLVLFQNDTTSAEVTETRTFNAAESLDVSTHLGDVEVTGDPTASQVTVQITRKAWGKDQAEAKNKAAALAVEMKEEGGKLTLSYQGQEPNTLVVGTYRSPGVSFKVTAPAKVAVNLRASIGKLTLKGTQGDAVVNSGFGDALVQDLQGALDLNLNNGDLTVKNVQAGDQDVRLQSSFGKLSASQLSGGKIEIQHENGDMDLRGLTASGDLVVRNSFGRLELNTVKAASLKLDSQNGDVTFKQGNLAGKLDLTNSFGKTDLSGVDAGSCAIDQQNGGITLDGPRGLLALSSSFGDITITNARDAVLKLKAQNGKVSFTGSLDTKSAQSVESSFGEVSLTIPADTAVDLQMEATFGKITSDLPVTLQGEMSENKWQGKLNGGGALLSIQSQNGGIALRAMK